MIRPVVRLLLALAGLYLAAKVWIYLQGSQWMDAVREQTQGTMALDYRWLGSAPLKGQIEIHDLSLIPFAAPQTLKATRLVIDLGDPFDLLKLMWEARGGFLEPRFFPDTAEISIEGLSIPFDPRWEQYLPRVSEPLRDLLMPPCGDRGFLTQNDLKAMDYDGLMINLNLAWAYDSEQSTLTLSQNLDLQKMLELGSSLDLAGVTESPAEWLSRSLEDEGSIAEPLAPELEAASLALNDQGLLQRTTALCSTLARQGSRQFSENALLDLQQDLAAMGVVPGPGLILALERFISGNGKIEIRVLPDEPINLANLALSDTGSAADQLPLGVAVNEQNVLDTQYRLDIAQLIQALTPPPEPMPPAEELTEGETGAKTQELPQDRPAETAGKSFVEVSLDSAGDYIGLPIRVRQSDGKLTTGVLLAVTERTVDVSAPMASGDVVFHIRHQNIEQIWVYR